MLAIDKMIVEVEAEVNPTEDIEKVKKALRNIFPELDCQTRDDKDGILLLYCKSLKKDLLKVLKELLMRERIRNAARSVMFNNISGDSVIFYLNKQVAYANHISFCSPTNESPLGPIKIKLRSKELSQLINWLAPSSKNS